MPIPPDYEERVYAGILGKIIGVYLGRPFEGWSHRRIEEELGEIHYYVHERLGKPLVVADDDISGTFTFARALEDHSAGREISAEQIGRTWLNYLIEKRTILWWGGMGTSTEHTAFLRLKRGIPAPRSGSMELNTPQVAEQIGAQIFIDSWAMLAPGEPELAAELAHKAASVSHDGEAIHGARALAAMEAAAFFESDLEKLLDIGLAAIPADCLIARLHRDVRAWHREDGDWRRTFHRIEEHYGYARYGGGCHMVPNHALIALALLYGEGRFQRSLMIANTAGWDTDCNSGNVGCLLGIRGGLAALEEGPDWRGPVADRLYKISADGGDGLTDAVRETYGLCRMGRLLLGAEQAPAPVARYHFSLPGSVQGFLPEGAATAAANEGSALALRFRQVAPGRPARAGTQIYCEPEELERPGYRMVLSPSLFPGQVLRARLRLQADAPAIAALYAQIFPAAPGKPLALRYGGDRPLSPGESAELVWEVPETGGLPIVRVGVEVRATESASGTLYLDELDVAGAPRCRFTGEGLRQYRAPVGWTDGVDRAFLSHEGARIHLVQDEGRGLLLNGTRQWRDYRFSARVAPHMAAEAGIAARTGGLRRFYALLLCAGGKLRLLQCYDRDCLIAERPFSWEPDRFYQLSLAARGGLLIAQVDGEQVFSIDGDPPRGARPLESGGVALVITDGRAAFADVEIAPLD